MSDLPEGWEWTTLDELAAPEARAITDGPFGSNLTSSHYTDSGARVIRLQNIGDGVFRDERAYIGLDHFERLRTHEVREGDLLVASLGDSPPRCCLTPALGAPAIVKADCIRVRISPHVVPEWVLHSLLSPATKKHAKALVKGVGRPRLGLSHIRSLPVPLPPIAEQKRIVDAIDLQSVHLHQANSALDAALRRVGLLVKAAITAAVASSERSSSWRSVPVAAAGRVDLGRQRHPDWHHGPNMKPYLRVANVFEDRIDLSDVMEMHFSSAEFERFRLVPGDILLNEGQSPEYLGRPAMYTGEPEEMAFTNSLLRFRAGPDVLPEWALLVFRHYMHSGRFMREVRITTNIAHLSAGRFKAVEFPIPPLDEQARIVASVREQLDEAVRLTAAVELGRSRADRLRRSVLAEAFAGRLVPHDPTDEPASELLARIRAEQPPTSRRTARR